VTGVVPPAHTIRGRPSSPTATRPGSNGSTPGSPKPPNATFRIFRISWRSPTAPECCRRPPLATAILSCRRARRRGSARSCRSATLLPRPVSSPHARPPPTRSGWTDAGLPLRQSVPPDRAPRARTHGGDRHDDPADAALGARHRPCRLLCDRDPDLHDHPLHRASARLLGLPDDPARLADAEALAERLVDKA